MISRLGTEFLGYQDVSIGPCVFCSFFDHVQGIQKVCLVPAFELKKSSWYHRSIRFSQYIVEKSGIVRDCVVSGSDSNSWQKVFIGPPLDFKTLENFAVRTLYNFSQRISKTLHQR